MINELKKTTEQRMKKSVESLQNELTKIRTSRASTALLEHITVDYYGNPTPLSQIASINVVDSRTLSISPWEKNLVPLIEKAIRTSDLGLNPATAGDVIRVPMPPLTEERRKELIKVVRQEAENARVAIRNIRRESNAKLKDLLKKKEITEDSEHQGEEAHQKLTDHYISEIEKYLSNKEKDLMSV